MYLSQIAFLVLDFAEHLLQVDVQHHSVRKWMKVTILKVLVVVECLGEVVKRLRGRFGQKTRNGIWYCSSM